jgi:NTP pyrophosphatase (non-canonical NTP hydrolase)
MELNEYQERAMATCMPSCRNYSYMYGNLASEVGELAGKIAKDIRKGDIVINENDICFANDNVDWLSRIEEYKAELGDIFWQAIGVCTAFGWTAEDVAQGNLVKLADRKERGVIDGDGDNR